MTMGIIARDSSGIEGQIKTGYKTVTDVVYRCKQRWREWTLDSDEHGLLVLRRGMNSRRGA